MNPRTHLIFMLGGLVLSSMANATILDRGMYLTDTQSGLDWLDVTESINRSYNDVSSNFGPGGDYYGWRYATGDEFNALVSNYTGIAVAFYGYTLQEPDRIDRLITMLGSTLDAGLAIGGYPTYDAGLGLPEGAGLDYTLGLLADWDRGIYVWDALLFDYDVSNSQPDSSMAHHSTPTPDYKWWDLGSFLVRGSYPVSVPEPSSFSLLMAGAIGFVAIRRKKMNQ